MWKIWSRSNKKSSVAVDQPPYRGNIDFVVGRRTCYEVKFEAEILSCFTKSWMSGLGCDPINPDLVGGTYGKI
jgi:hypothetical protein